MEGARRSDERVAALGWTVPRKGYFEFGAPRANRTIQMKCQYDEPKYSEMKLARTRVNQAIKKRLLSQRDEHPLPFIFAVELELFPDFIDHRIRDLKLIPVLCSTEHFARTLFVQY